MQLYSYTPAEPQIENNMFSADGKTKNKQERNILDKDAAKLSSKAAIANLTRRLERTY